LIKYKIKKKKKKKKKIGSAHEERKGPSIKIDVVVSLKELYLGTTVDVKYYFV